MEENESKVLSDGSNLLTNINKYFNNVFNISSLFTINEYLSKFWTFIYTYVPFVNIIIPVLKYVPTGIYLYRLINNMFVASNERIYKKKREIQDLELQIEIVNTKISVRDTECKERMNLVRREVEKLKEIRAKVQELIATRGHNLNNITSQHGGINDDEENFFLVEVLQQMGEDQEGVSGRKIDDFGCGETMPTGGNDESSGDKLNKKDYQFKIIKVTNIYKGANLKHYIKQKRLRRANKQALFNKKMANMEQMLENWQDMLSKAISNKLSLYRESHPIDVASQEAMGDTSKNNLQDLDSEDSEQFNSEKHSCEDYNENWYNKMYDDFETEERFYEGNQSEDIPTYGQFEFNSMYIDRLQPPKLSVLNEETSSQMETEVKSDFDITDCDNLIDL